VWHVQLEEFSLMLKVHESLRVYRYYQFPQKRAFRAFFALSLHLFCHPLRVSGLWHCLNFLWLFMLALYH